MVVSEPESWHRELVELAEWDWVVTYQDKKLHHLAAFDDPNQAGSDWGGPGKTTCGIAAEWLSIPGIFSRMDKPRCGKCCESIGYPKGKGSPKNDINLRTLVEERIGRRMS